MAFFWRETIGTVKNELSLVRSWERAQYQAAKAARRPAVGNTR
jgi:hypothetical protein